MMLFFLCCTYFKSGVLAPLFSNPDLIGVIYSIVACLFQLYIFLYVVHMPFVTHRRLHDLGYSGWWQLVTLIPLGQLLMIGFIFVKGVEGKNKYGDPPEF